MGGGQSTSDDVKVTQAVSPFAEVPLNFGTGEGRERVKSKSEPD